MASATCTIWVGIKLDYDGWESLKPKLADLTNADEDYLLWDADELLRLTGGVPLRLFRNNMGQEICGLGVEIYSHDWDSGPTEFFFSEIAESRAHANLLQFLESRDIDAGLACYIDSDYN